MQNFGRFAVQSHLVSGVQITTGVGYEYIRVINNSPYFLSLNFVGQGQIDFPECYLEDIPITRDYRGQLLISFTANLSNIAQAPSFLLSVNGYNPGEVSSPQAQPLTFVSNVGNTVTTNVMGLSVENAPTNTEAIDLGTVTNNRLVDIFNDHFVWSVEQATVAHQILKGQTAGKPLLIGQAGDHTEVEGTLDVNQNLFIVGSCNFDNGLCGTDGAGHYQLSNNIAIQWLDTGSVVRDGIKLDASNNLQLLANTAGGRIYATDQSGAEILHLSSGGISLSKGTMSFLTGSIARIAHNLAVACINGKTTVNHGLGAVPDIVLLTINSAGAGSTASVGYNPATLSSTQVDVWGNGNFNVDVTTIKF